MAESNLRALLASARGSNVRPDAPVGDAEMAAILGVLKGDEGNGDERLAEGERRDAGSEPMGANEPAAGR